MLTVGIAVHHVVEVNQRCSSDISIRDLQDDFPQIVRIAKDRTLDTFPVIEDPTQHDCSPEAVMLDSSSNSRLGFSPTAVKDLLQL